MSWRSFLKAREQFIARLPTNYEQAVTWVQKELRRGRKSSMPVGTHVFRFEQGLGFWVNYSNQTMGRVGYGKDEKKK